MIHRFTHFISCHQHLNSPIPEKTFCTTKTHYHTFFPITRTTQTPLRCPRAECDSTIMYTECGTQRSELIPSGNYRPSAYTPSSPRAPAGPHLYRLSGKPLRGPPDTDPDENIHTFVWVRVYAARTQSPRWKVRQTAPIRYARILPGFPRPERGAISAVCRGFFLFGTGTLHNLSFV